MVHLIEDRFDRDDGAIGASWNVFAINGGGITIDQTTAVGTVAGGGTSFAIARSTQVLDDIEQEARLSFVVQSTPGSFRLGFHSKLVGGVQIAGFAVDCVVTSITNIRLAIVTNPSGTAVVQIPGTIQQVDKTGLLRDGGTLIDVVQELRAQVRRAAAGIELLVYLNQDDDERPDLRWRFAVDQVDGGSPYFGVWHGVTANHSRVGEVQFLTRRAISSVTASESFATDRPTLGLLTEEATEWYERRIHSPNINPIIMARAANRAQRDLLNRLGDLALFMRREEDITLAISSPQRVAILPRRVGRVLRLGYANSSFDDHNVDFRVIGHDSNGRLNIHLPWSTDSFNFRMLYEPVVTDMVGAEDKSVIPNDYRECLVANMVKRLFRNEANDKEYKIASQAFDELFAVMRYNLQRHQRSRIGPLRVMLQRRVERTHNWRGY